MFSYLRGHLPLLGFAGFYLTFGSLGLSANYAWPLAGSFAICSLLLLLALVMDRLFFSRLTTGS